MSSSAAGLPFFDISDKDTLLFCETYLMESAAQCRIKATVGPEMSVPKSVIDMLIQGAEQMNASATELTKQMLTRIGEERLKYLEKVQEEKKWEIQRLSKFRVLSFRRAIYPEQKRRKTSVTAEIEIYRDEDRDNLF